MQWITCSLQHNYLRSCFSDCASSLPYYSQTHLCVTIVRCRYEAMISRSLGGGEEEEEEVRKGRLKSGGPASTNCFDMCKRVPKMPTHMVVCGRWYCTWMLWNDCSSTSSWWWNRHACGIESDWRRVCQTRLDWRCMRVPSGCMCVIAIMIGNIASWNDNVLECVIISCATLRACYDIGVAILTCVKSHKALMGDMVTAMQQYSRCLD